MWLGREKRWPPSFSGTPTGQHQGNQHNKTKSVTKTTFDQNPMSVLWFHHTTCSRCSGPYYHSTHLYLFHPSQVRLVVKTKHDGPWLGHFISILLTLEKCTMGTIPTTINKIDEIPTLLVQITLSLRASEHFLLSWRQSYLESLHINKGNNHLSDIRFTNIFFYSTGFLFILLRVSFAMQKFFRLM